MPNSILLTKPLKEIPRRLIYSGKQKQKFFSELNKSDVELNYYNMYDREAGKVVGTMISGPVVFNNKNIDIYNLPLGYKSYYVNQLYVRQRMQGHGDAFIQFAKHMSKQTGCEGRLHLVASAIDCLVGPPHLFYKKEGLVASSPYVDQLLDFAISVHKKLTREDTDDIVMYLPTKIKHHKVAHHSPNLFSKVKNLITKVKDKFTLK